MKSSHITKISSLIVLFTTMVVTLAGCNYPGFATPTALESPEVAVTSASISTPLPPPAETLVDFRVIVPPDTAPDDAIYLSILDEVTGLALNAKTYDMELVGPSSEEDGLPASRVYSVQLPLAIGSVIKYRYLHQSGPVQLAEHLVDGSAVRYRLYHVTGQGGVEDVVSRWTDSVYTPPTGRIIGEARDAQSDQPIPNLLVAAGGAQAISKADGSFVIEGLPPGVHNLVAYAMDGSYRTFQQGARVAVESTTPTPIELETAPTVNLLFVVGVPERTPAVPLRLAGNLFQLGNTFGNLRGDLSGVSTNMPEMKLLPDGRYSLTLSLPVGADIHYKYTLGDGFWNAEHTQSGEFRMRQVVVPDHNALIEDEVETWQDNPARLLAFDITVPDNTPPGDFVSIQFNPLIGWTEPLPMWQLEQNRWAYILYSPLNLPGNFNYRYCRNNQCGYADDAQTPGIYGIGRPIELKDESQSLSEPVLEWISLYVDPAGFPIPEAQVPNRGADYWIGVEWLPDYHPSWRALLPGALDQVNATGANWVVLSPTWTYGKFEPGNNPPVLAPLSGVDASWFDLVEALDLSQARGLNVALYPRTRTLVAPDEWWQGAQRDYSWWPAWFYQYRSFVLHHADLAQRGGADALILGGEDLAPALPGGRLADGTDSGVPGNAETLWRDLLNEVRARFSGQILWAVPHGSVDNPPPFLDAVDQVYLTWSPDALQEADGEMAAAYERWLDNNLLTFQIILGKPVILAVTYPSDPSLETQLDAYATLIQETAERDWLGGFVSRGYYPPAALQDLSASVHGKPAGNLLEYWFPRLVGAVAP
jgi:hypothetical protein